MATSATKSPLITVEKLIIHQTQGILSLEAAREGIKGFNANCQEQPMPFDELVNVMLIAQGFGATSLTAHLKIGNPDTKKLTWTLTVETTGALKAAPKPENPPASLTPYQQALADRVLAKSVGELAKQGRKGQDLNERALNLATSLQAGFSQLNPTTCSTRPASCEQ
ncbi:hypothetical protein SAMN04487958_114100 [Vreelandella subterranea]|uniref:Uncharacterized protein n=1 Tax=Vreelandella subterranea TaxID=416874 RepID=A0A1H9WG94_9GAMM|nr:hypothetical protein [Halomonas subterranea]SES32855.1 hypothetical protein SAMN04487958_114100 [Halomonas subterranea]